jgi:hypothetical protein
LAQVQLWPHAQEPEEAQVQDPELVQLQAILDVLGDTGLVVWWFVIAKGGFDTE